MRVLHYTECHTRATERCAQVAVGMNWGDEIWNNLSRMHWANFNDQEEAALDWLQTGVRQVCKQSGTAP